MAYPIIAALLSLVAQPQEPVADQPDPVAEAEEKPIIVTAGNRKAESERQTIVLGSKIPRKAPLKPYNIATSTGIGGLTPGSGMEPLSGQNRVGKRKSVTCASDDPAVGEEASCLLIEAQSALQENDKAHAVALYRFLNASEDFSGSERLAAARKLFAFGQAEADPLLREEALLRMLKTGAMPDQEAQGARRSLVTMALQRDNVELAVTRLRDVVAADPQDAQSLANLAILLRQEGQPDASEYMLRAIAARKAEGQAIPPGWAEFARR